MPAWLSAKMAVGSALLAILVALTVSYGSWRYTAGYRAGYAKVLPYQQRAARAEVSAASYHDTVIHLQGAIEDERRQALQQVQKAQAAAQVAAGERRAAEDSLAQWRQRFAAETAAPSCKKLMETRLCGISSF